MTRAYTTSCPWTWLSLKLHQYPLSFPHRRPLTMLRSQAIRVAKPSGARLATVSSIVLCKNSNPKQFHPDTRTTHRAARSQPPTIQKMPRRPHRTRQKLLLAATTTTLESGWGWVQPPWRVAPFTTTPAKRKQGGSKRMRRNTKRNGGLERGRLRRLLK